MCAHTVYITTAVSTGNWLLTGTNVGGFLHCPALLLLVQSPNPFSSDSVTPHKTKCLVDLLAYNNETGIYKSEIFS